MKKRPMIVIIIVSAVFFLYLFVNSVINVFHIFSNPDSFSLMPVLLAVIYLVLLFLHAGAYVAVMDKKEMNFDVEDQDEWWTRWDRI